jgi:hypothetical protein
MSIRMLSIDTPEVHYRAIRNHQSRMKKLSSRERSGWITRYCVDMTTREIFYPQNYHKVAQYNRIFVWPDDVAEAVGRMNLLPVE